MTYDVLAFNLAMLCAVFLHYLTFIFRSFDGEFNLNFYLTQSLATLRIWSNYSFLATSLTILAFTVCGVYDGARFRRIRNRIYCILLAVTFGSSTVLLIPYLDNQMLYFPRGVSILFFGLCMALMAGPRIFKPVIVWLSANLLENSEKGDMVRSVLIVGGAGYIGTVLSKYLLERDYKVRVLDLLLFDCSRLDPVFSHRNFELVKGDFRNIVDLAPALEGMDAVVHLGGLVGDPACAVNTQLTIDINVAATRMLQELCTVRGIKRFIFASTCSVYGIGQELCSEESGLYPVSLYARSKIDSESILLNSTNGAFQPTILRFATAFGWSLRPRFDLVVNTFAAKALVDSKIEVHGGNQWRPFVHIYDIARCIEMSLSAKLKRVGGQIFNVGDERLNHTIEQIAEIVSRVVPGTQVINKGDMVDPRDYKVSFAKVKKVLGFECVRDVEQGVREIVSELTNSDGINIADSEFSNVGKLKAMLAEKNPATRNRLHMASALELDSVKRAVGND